MNRFCKVLAALCLPVAAFGQQKRNLPPVMPESAIVSRLFEMPEKDINYQFTLSIPHGNFLIVEFKQLTDWRDQGAFNKVTATASGIAGQYGPESKNEQNSKRLDIHLPIENEPVTARFRENHINPDLKIFAAGDNAPLKAGMDTIRVLKTLAEEKNTEGDKEKIQVQYTFLLKDIKQIADLAADHDWQEQSAGVIDSVVQHYRGKWHHPNLWYHQLYVSYRPEDTDPQRRLVINNKRAEDEQGGLGKALHSDIGIGIGLIRNTLAPMSELGISYQFVADNDAYLYTRLSMNSFVLYNRQADNTYKTASTGMINIELGTGAAQRSGLVPYYRISIGFGVKVGSYKKDASDPADSRDLYKIFARYGITKALSTSLDAYLVPKHQERNFLGLSLILRIF